MFETGMSALVLKICSEYAKSLGLNFPPCTQQEINAICQWVDKHAVKDMTISQDGYNVTFTFKGEYDTTKEFIITIPKNVNIDELEKVLVGSESVVVNRTEDNSKLQVRLSQSVTTQINGKLDKPVTPTTDSAVTMLADGTVGTKPLSEIGGGSELYLHEVPFKKSDNAMTVIMTFYSLSDQSTSVSKLIDITHSNLLFKGTDDIGLPLICLFSPSNEDNFDTCDVYGINIVTGQTVEVSSAKFIKQNEIIMKM